jgi:N-methylhydantoinase A
VSMGLSTPTGGYLVGIDIGGTFVDYMVYDRAAGRLIRTKSVSGATDVSRAFAEALATVGVETASIHRLIHATTTVTNLILERDGARVGLLTTRGFRDVLEIGWSLRDDAYDLQWTKFVPLVGRPVRLEVDERMGPSGTIERPLDEDGVRSAARELVAAGVDAIAICFLHAYANPTHERRARALVAEEAPATHCVISSDVDPRLGEYERASTTVLSAYASPRLNDYVAAVERWVGGARTTYFMQSEGGVIPAPVARENPTALVMSGPAAGVLGACSLGRVMGLDRFITMDVGGTSTDVCIVVDGLPGLRDVLEVEPGIPLRSPSLDVISVGAGGGSIAWIDDGGALCVGPRSAGAVPGPACYGSGGQNPTVTDANVVLGLTNPYGLLGGRLKGNPGAALSALSALGRELDISAEDAALGVYRIANATMAQAIRSLTVQRGIDPRDFSLVAFGGAGGQHAVEVAREMQIGTVIFPPHPSAFSALGLLTADVRMTRTRPVIAPLASLKRAYIEQEYESLERCLIAMFEEMTDVPEAVDLGRFADLRYRGQLHSIRTPVVDWDTAAIADRFQEIHETRYGTRLDDPAETLNIGVTGVLALGKGEMWSGIAHDRELLVVREVEGVLEDDRVPIIKRASIGPGANVPTPCLVEEEDSMLYLPTGATAICDERGNIVCEVGV